MRLIPVLDLMGGRVVRGVAGQRDKYRPNSSCIVDGDAPVDTLSSLAELFEPDAFYVADLDGIRDGRPQTELLAALIALGEPLAIDAGIRTPEDAVELKAAGAAYVTIAGETIGHLDMVSEIVETIGSDCAVFSLDLMNGKPIGEATCGLSPRDILREVHDQGIRNLIVLDISSVGTNAGLTTTSLCHWMKQQHLAMHLWTGGGIRTIVDLQMMQAVGIDGVLIASALHDGRITPQSWKAFRDLSDDALRASDA
ncbi:MAG: hypothetical protein KDA80_07930 [Planctomycetaceae bacterium]|nr:hypothetical protein [Planctomycetaceae bacterium]